MRRADRYLHLWLAAVLLLAGCLRPSPAPTAQLTPAEATPSALVESPGEIPVSIIPLAGPIAQSRAEISGMAWAGDRLVIVPQFPGRFPSAGYGSLFTLTEQQLREAVLAASLPALTPTALPFDDGGLSRSVRGFEGFEAIAFRGNQAFLTIESSTSGGMLGYIVTGTLAADGALLRLFPESLQPIEPQAPITNFTDETILVTDDRVLTFYETNGANVNPKPVAHAFDFGLTPLDPIPFLTVEYRVTDASALQPDGRFWVINYLYPGDVPKLNPASDPIAARFPLGATHRSAEQVERILALRYTEGQIVLEESPPIQLQLDPDEVRNWEALVVLQDLGFLLMTDLYPTTLLGFVPVPVP